MRGRAWARAGLVLGTVAMGSCQPRTPEAGWVEPASAQVPDSRTVERRRPLRAPSEGPREADSPTPEAPLSPCRQLPPWLWDESRLRWTWTCPPDACDPAHRWWADVLPDHAWWDSGQRLLVVRVDPAMGPASWPVRLTSEAAGCLEGTIRLADTIPSLGEGRWTREEVLAEGVRRHGEWTTVAGVTDAPGRGGRALPFVLTMPHAPADGLALRVFLHGYRGSLTAPVLDDLARLAVTDPEDTYWWGEGAGGQSVATPTTALRVLAIADWVLRQEPRLDPRGLHVAGSSMGGAGAVTLGMLYPHRFAWVLATLGQHVPAAHRPARVRQLERLWGPRGEPARVDRNGPWGWQDLTLRWAEDPELRDLPMVFHHGLDDPIIHFGAVALPSPLSGESVAVAGTRQAASRWMAWDESGHGPTDPSLPPEWWLEGWDPGARFQIGRPHPVVVAASTDGDPGSGRGNGRVPWHVDRGFAGDVTVVGDTGWQADRRGTLGHGLHWQAERQVDEVHAWSACLWSDEPVTDARVAPRRTRRAAWSEGDRVRWQWVPRGGNDPTAEGEVLVDERGVPVAGPFSVDPAGGDLTIFTVRPPRP